MKAIILGAGQGRRLLPLTRALPKCLIPVEANRSILDLQLRALAQGGVREVTVMVGFGAEQVDRFLASRGASHGLSVHTEYNPFFASSDNLVTAWLARWEMTRDFVLLNGDTLFDPRILQRLLAAGTAPVNVTLDRKDAYDADDMKVAVNGHQRLVAIGKQLGDRRPDAEAIGLTSFRGVGVDAFREALDEAVRGPQQHGVWYTSVLDTLAQRIPVEGVLIRGLWWREIDECADLEAARDDLARRAGGGAPSELYPAQTL